MFGFEKFARRMGLGSLICLVAALIAMGGSAQAAPREGGLAILGVWVGERPDARLAADVARRLRQLGEQLQAGRSRSKADWSCADVPCLRKTAEELGADRLLQVAIQEVDHDTQRYLINIRLFDNASQQIAERQASCDGCTSSDSRADQIAANTAKIVESLDKVGSADRTSAAPSDSSPAYLPQIALGASPSNSVDRASRQPTGVRGRTLATFFLAGAAAASAAVAIGISVTFLTSGGTCVLNDMESAYDGNCHVDTLVPIWSAAAVFTTTALLVNYVKARR